MATARVGSSRAERARTAERRATADRPSLFFLAKVWACGLGLLSSAVVIALIWTSTAFQRAMGDVVRDTTSMEIASELELSLLAYQRLNALIGSPPDPAVLAMRAEQLAAVRELSARAPAYVASDRERRVLEEALDAIAAYLDERRRLEETGLAPSELVGRARPAFDRAISSLEELRGVNEEEVERAHARALDLDRLVNVVATAVGALLVLALVLVTWAVRGWVVRPLRDLVAAIRGYQAGELRAVAAGSRTREISEVAGAFNEMTAALSRQREAQLAFVGGVAHDLRNPLSALKTGIELAERDPSEETRARVLAMTGRQVGRLSRMVDDLLDAARIEAGQLELHVRTFDLRDAVREVLRLYEASAARHELSAELPERAAVVDGDPLRVEQVIANLVSNAIKYSPAGGRVVVRVDVTARDTLLEVEDEGIGIAPERASELFAPFRRLASDVAPGAGLGLSVARRIVLAHGGTIEVESEIGRGSIFRVRIPRAGREAA